MLLFYSIPEVSSPDKTVLKSLSVSWLGPGKVCRFTNLPSLCNLLKAKKLPRELFCNVSNELWSKPQALEFHLHIKLLCSSSAHQILMICHGPLNLITMHKVPSADLQCKAVCVSIRQADIAQCGLQCMPRGGWRVTETTSNSQSRDHASFVIKCQCF